MVAAQDSSAKTGAVPGGPGVVESFYDFFAQIYSSSFTANRPWPTSFRGSTAPTEAGTSRTDGSFSGPENQLPHARNQPENQSPQHRSRFSMVPGTPQAAETRSHQPHPLEYGWPGEEIRTPQKPSKANLPNPSAHVTPRGFPQQDLESTSGPSRTHVLREQKQRELREQREEAARQQEVILRQQQQELREQREQYLRQREEELWGKEEACPEPRQGDATPTPSRQAKALPQPPFQKRPEDRQPAQPHRNSQSDTYVADPEDLIDQHVAYFLRKNPEVRGNHSIRRRTVGSYDMDGREVQIEWQYATEPGGKGFLVVVDGPLRQPFSDYMKNTEENATYDGQDLNTSNLHMIARDRRISFNDTHKVYNRLEAMKVAKEQALVREKAAGYVKDGRDVPADELMTKYKKTIQVKLGLCRPKGVRPSTEEAPPSPEVPQTATPSKPPPAPVNPARSADPGPPGPSPAGRMPSAQGAPPPLSPSPQPAKRKTLERPNLAATPQREPSQMPGTGAGTPGLPLPPPLPVPGRGAFASPNPVLLGAGTPTSATSNGIFKTQLPGAWQQHSTPRTPSGAGPAALLPAAPPLPGAGSAWPKQNGFTLPNYQRVR